MRKDVSKSAHHGEMFESYPAYEVGYIGESGRLLARAEVRAPDYETAVEYAQRQAPFEAERLSIRRISTA